MLPQIDQVYNEKKQIETVYTSDSIQQETFPVSLEVGRIYFWSLDLPMQRSSLRKKQTNCQFKSRSVQDSIVLK